MADKKPKSYIGRALKRVEDPRLIKGIATYVDDMRLPGMLHVALLRSPYAHAKIIGIKTDAAKALAGVVGVFTGADVNDQLRPGPVRLAHARPEIAQAHRAGRRTAFILSVTPWRSSWRPTATTARDALDLIEVDYDPLPVGERSGGSAGEGFAAHASRPRH